jgi:hypothetical protein
VQAAVATLPWVEKASIQTDANKLQVKFTVTDTKQFKDEDVIAALKTKGSKYGNGAKKLSGPTDEKKAG